MVALQNLKRRTALAQIYETGELNLGTFATEIRNIGSSPLIQDRSYPHIYACIFCPVSEDKPISFVGASASRLSLTLSWQDAPKPRKAYHTESMGDIQRTSPSVLDD